MSLKGHRGDMNKLNFNKWFPVASFVFCLLVICGATFYYSPSWGLMDDDGFLEMAVTYWKNPANTEIVTRDFMAAGMYRPVVFVWATIFYKVFENWPAGFYMFIAVGNMAAMLLWGIVFCRFFNVRREDRYWSIFFFPLAFFVFTPFWNLFTYLSLQEKFIIFLAPLALYYFQNTYQTARPRDWIFLYFLLVLGMLSKATFIFVPAAIVAYAFLDLVFFRGRKAVSATHLMITGLSLVYYAFYTFTVQLKGDYTAKYKSGLTIGGIIGKILGTSVVAKVLLLTGAVGSLVFVIWALRKMNREYLFPCIIYCGLVVYLMLLLPWGLHSYLLSAVGPLALGAFFPLYAWIIRKGGLWKIGINVLIAVAVCFVFVGNNIPSISRMGDIGRTIRFIKENNNERMGRYFFPPPYQESALATGNYTKKDIVYCDDGFIRSGMLLPDGENYAVFADLFPSVELSGVELGDEVYANGTWKVFRVIRSDDHQGTVRIGFAKTLVQKLKVAIRDL